MPIGDLLELIVCTDCKTRVEYHEERDGYMSCECWVRSMADDPMPDVPIADSHSIKLVSINIASTGTRSRSCGRRICS